MKDILISFVLPVVTALLAWFGNAYRNKQKKEHDILDNVQRIIDMQNSHIARCEEMLDKRDKEYKVMSRKNDRKREAIKKAYNCKVPSEECPVLIYDAQIHERDIDDSRCETCVYKKQEL